MLYKKKEVNGVLKLNIYSPQPEQSLKEALSSALQSSTRPSTQQRLIDECRSGALLLQPNSIKRPVIVSRLCYECLNLGSEDFIEVVQFPLKILNFLSNLCEILAGNLPYFYLVRFIQLHVINFTEFKMYL